MIVVPPQPTAPPRTGEIERIGSPRADHLTAIEGTDDAVELEFLPKPLPVFVFEVKAEGVTQRLAQGVHLILLDNPNIHGEQPTGRYLSRS